MKTSIKLLLFALFVNSTGLLFGQITRNISSPSNAEAQSRFSANANWIKEELEKETGYKFAQLKQTETLPSWEKSYSYDGEQYAYKWPEDRITNFWMFETPKDKDGLYKIIGVFIHYRRLDCSRRPCLLQNTYSFEEIGVTAATTKGYQEITLAEAEVFAQNYLKTGKAKAFSDFVQIDEIQAFQPDNLSPKRKRLSYSLVGIVGIYNFDRTTIMAAHQDVFPFDLYVTLKNSGWEVDSLVVNALIPNAYYFTSPYQVGANNEFYQSYGMAGFDAVYKNNKQSVKPKGMDEALLSRMSEFANLITTKGAEITKDDLGKFMHNEIDYTSYPAADTRDEVLANLEKSPQILVAKSIHTEEASIELTPIKLKDGTEPHLPKGNVSVKAQLEKFAAKGGKPSGKMLGSGNVETDFDWIYVDGNWFILNPGSYYITP